MKKYFPTFLTKAGEFVALGRLPVAVKINVVPVLEVLPGAAAKTEQFLLKEWTFGGNQVCIDASEYGHFDRSLRLLFNSLLSKGVNVIPVIQQNSDARYVAFVQSLIVTFGCKICIRTSNTSGGFQNYPATINSLMGAVGSVRSNTLLLIDLGYVEVNNYNLFGSLAVMLINSLMHLQEWSEIIVSSSSFPENLSHLKPSNRLYPLPRLEWDIWNIVSSALGKRVKYGDYGTKYPFFSDTAFPGSSSIKYTTAGEYLIYRGDRAQDHADGNGQYITFAGRLITHPDYSGVGFSWGDDEIYRIAHEVMANPKKRPGSPTTWVQISQNHHITLLDSLL